MQSLHWYYHRLRRMDLSEILWRIGGASRELIDLARIPTGLFPKTHPAVAWAALEPGFSVRPAVHRLPEARLTELRAAADRVLENRLSFFQHADLHLGDDIDWHRDWNQGLAAPTAPCPLVDYRVASVSGDCKEVWEPSRHHQLVVLARAWFQTRDAKYGDGAVRVWESWLDANPFGHGMNWKNPLELGVRLVNWVWALDLLRDYPMRESSWARIHVALAQHVWDLGRKFSRGSSANNHLVGEAAGVFVATSYLPMLPDSARLRALTREILCREILSQFHCDGGTQEQALGYQFFSIQFFTVCALVGERTGEPMPPDYLDRLQRACAYLATFGEGGNELPFYGDKDDGYVLNLGDHSHDVRWVSAVSRVMFGDARVATCETAYWLFDVPLETQAGHEDTTPGALRSHAWPESGHYLLQCGEGANRISVHVDCAPLGYGSIAAHGHADALAFDIRLGGLAMLVDPGTFDYFTQPDWRDAFRRTLNHNTACIDDEDQSEMLGAFLWGRRTTATPLCWQDDEAVTFFRGAHDGYAVLVDPVSVERSYCLDKARRVLEVEDDVRGQAPHRYAAAFHFHPDCAVTVIDGVVEVTRCGRSLSLRLPEGVDVAMFRGDEKQRLGWFSAGYHHKQPATTVVVRTTFEGACKLRYAIALNAADAAAESRPVRRARA
ncbi:MAG: alginate lyase family protein [Pseudomonadales bacterium]|nr:alginate lyase family protein [Pseudomonadales bacterium]